MPPIGFVTNPGFAAGPVATDPASCASEVARLLQSLQAEHAERRRLLAGLADSVARGNDQLRRAGLAAIEA